MLAPAVGSGAPVNSKKRNYVLHEDEKFMGPRESSIEEVYRFVLSCFGCLGFNLSILFKTDLNFFSVVLCT